MTNPDKAYSNWPNPINPNTQRITKYYKEFDGNIRFTRSFCFPELTSKILVFDGDISLSIYDQAFYEDLKDTDEEALNFDTGESLEYWVKLYWDSLVTLEEYKAKKPYPKPEVLVFESIPKEIIQVWKE